ncbi:hypothetical protein D3C72_922290 [compost metagenome]
MGNVQCYSIVFGERLHAIDARLTIQIQKHRIARLLVQIRIKDNLCAFRRQIIDAQWNTQMRAFDRSCGFWQIRRTQRQHLIVHLHDT